MALFRGESAEATADREFFAACTLGLEEVLQRELLALGARRLERRAGGVGFHGDRKLGYAANLWLHCAVRVQELILKEPITGPEDLYDAVAAVDWDPYLTTHLTLAVDATVKNSCIRHSGFAAMRVKDAIVDQQRRRIGRRSNVDTESPDLRLKLLLRDDRLQLYRDYSGESLHKRGYRPVQVKSPLNEAIAAGLLLLSGWTEQDVVVDPMCGSATFLIEAAWMAARRAPGWMRHFAFERWPDFDAATWERLREEATSRINHDVDFVCEGADRHAGALSIARESIQAAGALGRLRVHLKEIGSFTPTRPPTLVVVNPPYGERIGEGSDLLESWKGLGDWLQRHAESARAFVLVGDAAMKPFLGPEFTRSHHVFNGPIDCEWLERPAVSSARG